MSATMNDDHLATLEEEDGDGRKKLLVVGALMLVLGGLGYWGVSSMSGKTHGPKQQTVKIAILPETPPRPPPKEERKIEPEKKLDQPQQQQDIPKLQEAPPEPQQLKMDGPAGDGPSAFAAGDVNSEYKGGEIGTGTSGGQAVPNKMQFALFSNQLQRHIQAALAKEQGIKLGDYRLNVQVWLGPAGDFQRVELLSSTGDPKTDEALQAAFKQLPAMQGVPANLPQPIRLRITNRMTG